MFLFSLLPSYIDFSDYVCDRCIQSLQLVTKSTFKLRILCTATCGANDHVVIAFEFKNRTCAKILHRNSAVCCVYVDFH
jgi:hypothetical protein